MRNIFFLALWALFSFAALLMTICITVANAATYGVSFNIDPTDNVTGSIVTNCGNCALDATNIISWSFMLNGNLGFSSSDVSATIYTRGVLSPLTVLNGVITYGPSQTLGVIEFCVGSSGSPCNFPSIGLAFIDEGVNVVEYIERRGTNDEIAPGYSGQGLTEPINIAAVPESSTWAMLLIGFAGIGFAAYRRKDRKTSLTLQAA
jgi:hypothetical protein